VHRQNEAQKEWALPRFFPFSAALAQCLLFRGARRQQKSLDIAVAEYNSHHPTGLQTRLPNGGVLMKKLIVLALVVLGLLAIVPAMELQSSTQVFSRVGMAEGGGGE